MAQGEGGADCGRRYYIVPAGMSHPRERVVLGEEGDARSVPAAATTPGDEGRGQPSDRPLEREPLGAEETAERGGGLRLLEAELGEIEDAPAERMDTRPQPAKDRFESATRRRKGVAGVNRKPNPVAAVTGGRWSFLYPRGLPRGRRRVSRGAA